jgi:DNA-binding transcriptional LysR family regulator
VVDLAGDPHMANLDRREADIALRLSRPSGDGLIARKIGEMPFALYASTDYAENNAETDWAFIVHDDFPQELPQQRWLKTVIGDRSVAFRSNDVLNLAAAAAAGLGVALLPDFLGKRDPTLVRLPWSEPTPCRDIWMAVHDDLRRTPRIRAVMNVLIEICG